MSDEALREQTWERACEYVERRMGVIKGVPEEQHAQLVGYILSLGLDAIKQAGGAVLMPVVDPSKLDKAQFVFERMGFVTDMYDVPIGMSHHYVGPGYFSSIDQVYVNVLDEQP